jgi:hypothetical protein
MGWPIRTVAAALAAAAAACAGAAQAQAIQLAIATTESGAPVPAVPAPQLRTLIGAQAIEASSHPAVISLAATDYPYAPGEEIGLPLTRTLLTGGSGDPLSCLTQAIYYEARSEPLEGQQAVAQVVLNRMRDGRYPKSVCQVIYQGGQRRTGCQFTFVCDGSMHGRVKPAAWDRAKTVAERALGGYEYAPLVGATHYHASWMTPYWSSSLVKMRQIGGHVFYR